MALATVGYLSVQSLPRRVKMFTLPASSLACTYLVSAYALKGEADRAAKEIAEARRLLGGKTYSSIAAMKAARPRYWGVEKIRALYEASYFAGLRKAGMPEE